MLLQLIISGNVQMKFLKRLQNKPWSVGRLFDLAADDSSKYVSSLMFILRNKGSVLLRAAVWHPSSEHVLAEGDNLEKWGPLPLLPEPGQFVELSAWSSGRTSFLAVAASALDGWTSFSFSPCENKSQCIAATECCLYIEISRVLEGVWAARKGFCSSFYVISQGRFRLHVFLLDFLAN